MSVSYLLANQCYVYLINELFKINLATNYVRGGVSEWPMVTVLKTVVGASRPWVRIPPPPFILSERNESRGLACVIVLLVSKRIMWYVYILRSARDNKLYIGATDDISRRLLQHNSGEVDTTKNRMPLILEAYLAVKDKAKAIALEEYFKTGSGSAILNKRIL